MSARLSLRVLPRLAALASFSAITACSGDGIVVPGDGSIARLVAVAGDGQRAIAGQPVAHPLVVRAVDQSNRPVTGTEITFRFINADGRVAPGTVATGADGQATAAVTLGGSVGAQVVEARVVDPEGLAVEFNLTALQQETPEPPDTGGNGGGNGNGGNGNGDDGGSVGGGGGGGGGDVEGGSGGGSAGGDDGNGGSGGSAGGGD
ncbi:MAG TPA: Ig-like domain-containing protein, partial [Gemmatimonadales bacterium]|nr:Ig-like domain-containing protein [Gemmatimonadales bacterium]